MTIALRILFCGTAPPHAFADWPDTQVRYCSSSSIFVDYEQFNPNLVMLDAQPDPMFALQLGMSLRAVKQTANLPVVVFAPQGGDQIGLDAFRCGIDDVLERIDDIRSWLRLQSLVRRHGVMASDGLLRVGDIELSVDQRRVRRAGRPVALSVRQFDLLRFLMERPGQVFSRTELLRQCWGNPKLDEGTVTACVLRLRRALTAQGEPNPIFSIPGGRYALESPALKLGFDSGMALRSNAD